MRCKSCKKIKINKCNHGGIFNKCLCQNCGWDCVYCCDGIDEEGNCVCDEFIIFIE